MIEQGTKSADAQEWLDSYRSHLENVLGLADLTCRIYCGVVGKLLAALSADGCVDASRFTAEAISEFVRRDAQGRARTGKRHTIAPVRSFLRFLTSKGVLRPGLEGAVPMIRCWAQASLPQPLNKSEIAKVLKIARKNCRSHAIVLLLSRLGLRAQEVAGLRLDDIEWTNGSILIRGRKTHTERILPLPQDVGKALFHYLQTGRPSTNHQEVFVRNFEPVVPLTPGAVARLSRTLLFRAGIRRRTSYGAHLFRHTAATQMINSGVSFKEIADLLGHQSLQTTAIYAKLDLQSLSKIAMPWPVGGQQ